MISPFLSSHSRLTNNANFAELQFLSARRAAVAAAVANAEAAAAAAGSTVLPHHPPPAPITVSPPATSGTSTTTAEERSSSSGGGGGGGTTTAGGASPGLPTANGGGGGSSPPQSAGQTTLPSVPVPHPGDFHPAYRIPGYMEHLYSLQHASASLHGKYQTYSNVTDEVMCSAFNFNAFFGQFGTPLRFG